MKATRLRTRLVAAFVATAVLTTVVAALLTSWGLHRSFDDYLDGRADEAGRSAQVAAQAAYVEQGSSWTPAGVARLSRELVLTGYDFRLIAGKRVLFDTTDAENTAALSTRPLLSLRLSTRPLLSLRLSTRPLSLRLSTRPLSLRPSTRLLSTRRLSLRRRKTSVLRQLKPRRPRRSECGAA